MKKTTLIALLFPLCATIAQTTDDFVPQEMDWGTYFPSAQIATAQVGTRTVEYLKTTQDRGLLFAYRTKDNNNTEMEQEYFISADAFQSEIAGGEDVYIGKLNTGGQLEWGTYFGGAKNEVVSDMVLDGQDNLYVSGSTLSTVGIATAGADKEDFTAYLRPPLMIELPDGSLIEVMPEVAVQNGFLTKFNSEGELLWSTYIAGHRGATGGRVFVSDTGVFVSGSTLSIENFTTPGVFQSNWPEDVPTEPSINLHQRSVSYLAKYSFEGILLWRTYTFGLGSEIRIDSIGNLCFVPNKNDFINDSGTGEISNNLTKINGVNSQLLSTLALPNILENKILDFELDGALNHYFVIDTEEEGLGTPGSFRPDKVTSESFPNSQQVFLKYNIDMQLQYATYLPFESGTPNVFRKHIYLTSGEVVIGSLTKEANLGTEGVFQSLKSGEVNAYLLKLNDTGSLDWFTYLGSENVTSLGFIAAGDFQNEVYVSIASTGIENVVNENGLFSDPFAFEPLTGGYRVALMKLVKSKSSSTDDFLKGKINVYPNPAKDILNIDLSDELLSNPLSYALYDLLGKQIANGSLAVSQNHPINVSNLATGVYLLKITDQNTQVSQQFKIIKE